MNEWSIWALIFLLERDRWAFLEEPPAAYGLSLEEYETRELVSFVERALQEVRRRNGSARSGLSSSNPAQSHPSPCGQGPVRVPLSQDLPALSHPSPGGQGPVSASLSQDLPTQSHPSPSGPVRMTFPPDLPALGVRITRNCRIFVGSKELKIRPMAKTILLLFLRHPEGIPLKLIGNYREELAGYYRRVSRSSDREEIESRVRRMEDIFNNELNVNIARVNAAISALVEAPYREQYRIAGRAGQSKRIGLDRSIVNWEW